MKKQIEIFILCFCLPLANAFATERWYDIEVLAFAHEDEETTAQATTEHWPQLAGFPNLIGAAYLAPQSKTPRALQQTQTRYWNLNDSHRHLNFAKKRVLLHTQWRQHLSSEHPNQAVRLYGGKHLFKTTGPTEPPALSRFEYRHYYPRVTPDYRDYLMPPYPWEIEGTIQLQLSRYLHVNTDFVFQQVGHPYRQQGTLRMRSKELHYIDHPKFGMLIRITPVAA